MVGHKKHHSHHGYILIMYCDKHIPDTELLPPKERSIWGLDEGFK